MLKEMSKAMLKFEMIRGTLGMLEKRKVGGNPKGTYEEEAPKRQETQLGQSSGPKHRAFSTSTIPLRQSQNGECNGNPSM